MVQQIIKTQNELNFIKRKKNAGIFKNAFYEK